MDAGRARGEERERPRDDRDPVQPGEETAAARLERQGRGARGGAARLGARKENRREREQQQKKPREQEALARRWPLGEPAPRPVPRIHAEPVLRQGGIVHGVASVAREPIEPRGLLVGNEKREEGDSADSKGERATLES